MDNICNIVNDLLPLYVDNILSEDSRQFVENHLSSCDKCKIQLENLKTDVTVLPED